MKKVIHKWFIDWEKEEAWINKMASQGLALTAIGFFRFEFEECVPGEYQYRCELLDNLPNHPESERYIRFVEKFPMNAAGKILKYKMREEAVEWIKANQ